MTEREWLVEQLENLTAGDPALEVGRIPDIQSAINRYNRLLLALDTLEAVEKNCSPGSIAVLACDVRRANITIAECESWGDWLDNIARTLESSPTPEREGKT